MINNRQNGRRRGRGGQPQRGGQPGAPDRGNRLDNRARGNAAQLLEKYKTLARDAQMQGDRVNTEYYLQFADHYFRVLSESRSRYEEQNQQRRQQGDYRGGEDYDDGQGEPRPIGVGPDAQGRPYDDSGNDGDGDDGGWDDGADAQSVSSQPQLSQPQVQPQGQGRPRRDDRREAGEARGQGEQRPRRANGGNGNGAYESGNGGGGNGSGDGYANRGYDSAPVAAAAPERIEMDRIPPSLTVDAPIAAASEPGEGAAPRRRTRRPRDPSPTTEV